MTLKSDDLGFLQGEPVHWNRALKLWGEIRDEVHALSMSMSGSTAQTKRAATNAGGRVPIVSAAPRMKFGSSELTLAVRSAVSVMRDERGRFVRSPSSEVSDSRTGTEPGAVKNSDLSRVLEAAERNTVIAERHANGRFRSGENGAPGGGDGKRTTRPDGGIVQGAIGATASGVAHVIGDAPDIDPNIAVAKEIGAIVAPIGRGFGKLFGKGDEKKKAVWFKKFWTELRGMRTEDSAFHRAELRRLAEISNQSGQGEGQSSGGIGGMLGGLLSKFPGLGMLGSGLGGIAKGALGLGKGFFKRLPLLGALISGGSALASIFGNDDPEKSPEENRTSRFTGGGSGIGAIVGGAIGILGGPAGIVIGGMIGDKVGELVGAWLSTFDWSKIGDQIVGAWNDTLKWFSDTWKSITDTIKPITDAAKTIVDGITGWLKSKSIAANDAIKNATGVDVKAGATQAAALVAATAKAGVQAAKAGAGAVVGYGQERATKMAVPLVRAATTAKDWISGGLGTLIGKREGDYGSYNRGMAGDAKGQKIDFSNMSVDDIMARQAKAKSDQGRLFAVGKYQVIPDTMKGAVASMGLTGKEKFTPELQERMFSEYLTDKKRPDISGYVTGKHDDLDRATLAVSKEWASVENPLTGKSYYDKTGNNKAATSAYAINEELKSARNSYRVGIANGLDAKQAYAVAMGNSTAAGSTASSVAPAISTASPTVATPPFTAIPAMPSTSTLSRVPSVPDTPATSELIKIGTSKPVVIQVESGKRDVGQEVSDRRIAHIATAGLSSSNIGRYH